ncbi:hypothetical protein, partial [Cysteiniphilum sp. E12A11]
KANDIVTESEIERFDADFVIMTETLSHFIEFMMGVFSKKAETTDAKEAKETEEVLTIKS